jgi:hypothetical protein
MSSTKRPPDDHPLFALPNVILTPHGAGLSKKAAIRMAISTARNVLAGIDGKPDPSMVINREVLRDAVSSRSRCQPERGPSSRSLTKNFPLPCLQAVVGQNGRRGRLIAHERTHRAAREELRAQRAGTRHQLTAEDGSAGSFT